ncbi:MAG: protease complex subunit PrcB family protein [Oceanospirillaceae bacterium]|nr:protease complex subunit PrcB family protein [Oceanospirillaceae bacterium]
MINVLKNKAVISLLVACGALISCSSTALSVSEYEQRNQCLNAKVASASFISEKKITDSALVFSLQPKEPSAAALSQDDAFWFVKVAMGVRPTAGYYFKLLSEQTQIVDGRVSLTLGWQQPAPGNLSAQVITNPCIYLKIAKADYQHIAINDEQGRARFLLKTPD